MSQAKSSQVRRNFTMSAEDSRRLDELARLVVPEGEEPNASLAIRLAVRNMIQSLKKGKKSQ